MENCEQCGECVNNLKPTSNLSQTTCCQKFKCGECANPCDSNDCESWLCNLDDPSADTCFGSCPTHSVGICDPETFKEHFTDAKDHDEQLRLALSKFSSMGCGHLELTCLEQLLVNEELNISHLYPQLKGLVMTNPFLDSDNERFE